MKYRMLVAATLAAAAMIPLGNTAANGQSQRGATAPVDKAATRVTFLVDDCKGCKLTAVSADADHPKRVWVSPEKKVKGGEVSFAVPTAKTQGLSVQVEAPWEGHTGYITVAAMRYAHEKPGSRITLADARDKHRASGCWAGTDETDVTMRLVVRKVTVPGVLGPTKGSIAFLRHTQEYLKPMVHAPKGVVGTQEPMYCEH